MERVANQEWIKEMANGKWVRGGEGKGMDSALWVMQGDCRTFSLLQLLRFIVFVEGTRGTVGGTACSGLVLCGSARLSQRGARDALCVFSR